MTPLVVIGTLAAATVLFAWGSAKFFEDERPVLRWIGFGSMMAGAAGLVSAGVMVVL